MSEENKNVLDETAEEAVVEEDTVAAEAVVESKKEKKAKDEKKVNFFVRLGGKIKKLCKDTFNEMKKVRWTPKKELVKSSVLVVVAVAITALALALVDSGFAWIINAIAGLI